MSVLHDNAIKHAPTDNSILQDSIRTFYRVQDHLDEISNSIRDIEHLVQSTSDEDDPMALARDAMDCARDLDNSLDKLSRTLADVKDAYMELEERAAYWETTAQDHADYIETCMDDLGMVPVEMEGWKTEWVVWIRENIKSKWTLAAGESKTIFYFENTNDATYFKVSAV